jgi:hypothetical protein
MARQTKAAMRERERERECDLVVEVARERAGRCWVVVSSFVCGGDGP